MLGLKENSPIEMLREFSVYFDADLHEDYGAASMIIDNSKGKGSINAYELFPGLTAWVYDINFASDLVIDFEFSNEKPLYFSYVVSGYQLQKFPDETEFKKIQQSQNFILVSEPGKKSKFEIPGNTKFECCYLIINPKSLGLHSTNSISKQLRSNLNEIFDNTKEGKPYRYFGDIDARIGTFARIVIRNKRTDLVGRLLTQAGVLNMLASQIEAHDHDLNTESFQPTLTKEELSKITELGDYIRKNISNKLTVSELSREIGMSLKKLQSGIQFLYGYSANQYITNLRLEYAKELIQSTDYSVSEICYQIGYTSRSYFSNLFKKRFGVLPSEYKNSFLKDDLLFEVTYRSMAFSGITNSDIENIIVLARALNEDNNITGSLIYHRKVFFQLIEGPKKNVLKLYERIKKDKRHSDIITMWKGPKPSRDFKLWSMAMISDNNILNISYEGNTEKLNLGHLMGELDDKSLASKNLWRKVRNIIKTAKP
ncbi:BLUF domain-containing protein [Aquimarina rubra]|uniref:BLUF domain-containing protein n=1 Tax=Aquimarina rubra TaxID=1920033 RepID=A0ABW5LEU2_9FLAO